MTSMNEQSIMSLLEHATNSAEKIDSVEEVMRNVRMNHGKLVFGDLRTLFALLRPILLDRNSQAVLAVSQLLVDLTPEYGNPDVDGQILILLPNLIKNISIGKPTISKTTSEILRNLVRYSNISDAVLSSMVQDGLEAQEEHVRRETAKAFRQILSINSSRDEFERVVEALVGRLRDISDEVVDEVVLTLAHIKQIVGESGWINRISKLQPPALLLYETFRERVDAANEPIPILTTSTSTASYPSEMEKFNLLNYFLKTRPLDPTLNQTTSPSFNLNQKQRANQSRELTRSIYSASDQIESKLPAPSHRAPSAQQQKPSAASSTLALSHAQTTNAKDLSNTNDTSDVGRLHFGFVPDEIFELLEDSGDWRRRSQGIEQLQNLVNNLDDVEKLTSHASSLLEFFTALINDNNFKVNFKAIQILDHFLSKIGAAIKPHLELILPPLLDKLADSKIGIRQLSMKLLHHLMQILTPVPILNACISCVSHENYRVREEVVNLTISCLLTFSTFPFDFVAIVVALVPALSDVKAKVKYVATEAFAVLAQRLSPDFLLSLLEQSGVSASTRNLLMIRFQTTHLPCLGADGLVEHMATRVSSGMTSRQENRRLGSILSQTHEFDGQKLNSASKSFNGHGRAQSGNASTTGAPAPLSYHDDDANEHTRQVPTTTQPRYPRSSRFDASAITASLFTTTTGQFSPDLTASNIASSRQQFRSTSASAVESAQLSSRLHSLAPSSSGYASKHKISRQNVDLTSSSSSDRQQSENYLPWIASTPQESWGDKELSSDHRLSHVQTTARHIRAQKHAHAASSANNEKISTSSSISSTPQSSTPESYMHSNTDKFTKSHAKPSPILIPSAKPLQFPTIATTPTSAKSPNSPADSIHTPTSTSTTATRSFSSRKKHTAFRSPTTPVPATAYATLMLESTPELEFKSAMTVLKSSDDWEKVGAALERLLKLLLSTSEPQDNGQGADRIDGEEEDDVTNHSTATLFSSNLHPICILLSDCVQNLRTQVSRVAIALTREMFRAMGKCFCQGGTDLDMMVSALLKKAGEGGRDTFMTEEVESALLTMCRVQGLISSHRAIAALLVSSDHRNAQVRAKVASCVAFILSDVEGNRALMKKFISNIYEMEKLLPVLIKYLSEGLVTTRNSAKFAFFSLDASYPSFEQILERSLPSKDVGVAKQAIASYRSSKLSDQLHIPVLKLQASTSSTLSSRCSTSITSLSASTTPSSHFNSFTTPPHSPIKSPSKKHATPQPKAETSRDVASKRTISSSRATKTSSKNELAGESDWSDILTQMDSSDWQSRHESLEQASAAIMKVPIAPPQLLRLFDVFLERLRDGNSKVHLLSLTSLKEWSGELNNQLEPVLGNLVPVLVANLSSASTAPRTLTSEVFDRMILSFNEKTLVVLLASFCSILQYGGSNGAAGTVKAKTAVIEKVLRILTRLQHLSPGSSASATTSYQRLIQKYIVPSISKLSQTSEVKRSLELKDALKNLSEFVDTSVTPSSIQPRLSF